MFGLVFILLVFLKLYRIQNSKVGILKSGVVCEICNFSGLTALDWL